MMKICSSCGQPNAAENRFCENCGADLAGSPAGKRCPRCQTVNAADNRFCENCGYDFETTTIGQTDSQTPPATTSEPAAESATATDATSSAATWEGGSAGGDQSAASEAPVAASQVPPRTDTTSQTQPTRQATSSTAPKSTADRPQTSKTATRPQPGGPTKTPLRAAQHQPKKPQSRLVAGLVLVILVLAVGAFVYYQKQQTTTVKPAAVQSSRKAKSHSKTASTSSSSSRQSSSTNRSTASKVTFHPDQVRADINNTIAPLSGDSEVYVTPVKGSQQVSVNNGSQRSASTIKIFILVTAYALEKEGAFDLNDEYTISDDDKVGGTGVMRTMADGTTLTYHEVLTHMIADSDNMAANVMIDALGGFKLINNKIESLGATDTQLNRKMMDTDALEDGDDNVTSAEDLGQTLKKMYNHKLVSADADRAMLTILAQNHNRTKLPHDLPGDATVYNKTGEFADYGVQNDAAIMANKRGAFVVVVLSQDGQQTEQVDAMNRLGLQLYQDILK
ncbi:serine hydrolase [Lactiplantibacillus modestisalitolerans]|uniref:Serine hydrolase n=1 Tax=Lactiplantibacillus modestisalitolerans TaxID=1457219 RepID=A0ABV5WT86_9LACO|nr:serine hydrolase [Lactiplantibacillus modestisalitolerans]